MENNFEAGETGGSSMSGQGGSGFDSCSNLGSFEVNQPTDIYDSGKMTSMDYLKDGVDKGYYIQDTEGVFSLEEVMSGAQEEMSKGEEKEWDIMDIPGTSHQKLENLSKMSDEEMENTQKDAKKEVGEVKGVEKSSFPEKEKLSFEQEVIKIQAEAIKLFAESLNNNSNKKDLEELLKKLQELMKKADNEKSEKKETLLAGALAVVDLVLKMTEEGYKKLEHETNEVSA